MDDKYTATVIIFGLVFTTYIIGMVTGVVKQDGAMLGTLGTLAGTIIGFFWGKSQGKSEAICELKP